MNLEESLRNSSMDYSLKANYYLRGIAFTPCLDCPFKNEYPPVPLLEKTKKCFQRCPFEIIIWILDKEQLRIYEKLRPPELKLRDFQLAIKQGKLIQIEEFSGRDRIPSFLFFLKSIFCRMKIYGKTQLIQIKTEWSDFA